MKIYSIVFMFLLVGCYTTNKAKKQVIKAHALKPNVTAELCTSFYPTKDSTVKETITVKGKNDTVTNMVTDTIHDSTTNTIYLDRTKYITRVDTVHKTFIQTKESTSKVKQLSATVRNLEFSVVAQNESIKNIKSDRNKWRLYFFTLLSFYLLKVVITKKVF